ncbi:MAG TPA: thymidine phosphorylase [Bacteroidetes bacterium]|nr:thymidine phosphorylase [Bacteroidota bacterium]
MADTKSFNMVSLIRKKREKLELTTEEIRYMIAEYTRDVIPDYQMSAMLMAIYLNGLTDRESSDLTYAMLHSGIVIDLSHIPGIKVDKHSTGGVGDKLSLILAPIVAACGVPVPMISGRGLGHSGGTLDKLESIPGFNVNLDLDTYAKVLAEHNLVLIGQTEEIAPADKRMYALRDVTSTVECIPLIAGSIMSKKLAEGIDALVLDVKCGSGAFMKTQEAALQLAQKLVSIGEHFGKRTVGYITNMDQPLGHAIGNWLEVRECIDALQGRGEKNMMEVTLLLSGTMIWLGGKANSVDEGIEMSVESINNGTAFQKFVDICKVQGGDTKYLLNPDLYPPAKHIVDVLSSKDGFIGAINSFEIGMTGVELGAGRIRKEDIIDPAAGIEIIKKHSEKVRNGETIARIYTNNTALIDSSVERILGAIEILSKRPDDIKMVSHKVDREGIQLIV